MTKEEQVETFENQRGLKIGVGLGSKMTSFG
ncbi:hypothetical protein IX299_001881 [Porphyromonas levii]|nr:hypothetical protein [Porphyromonas levii]